MAQRKVRAGGTARLFQSQQQQHLVGAVGCRMNRFGQHRTGTGPEGGNVLRYRNAEIGAEGVENGPYRTIRRSVVAVGHQSPLSVGMLRFMKQRSSQALALSSSVRSR